VMMDHMTVSTKDFQCGVPIFSSIRMMDDKTSSIFRFTRFAKDFPVAFKAIIKSLCKVIVFYFSYGKQSVETFRTAKTSWPSVVNISSSDYMATKDTRSSLGACNRAVEHRTFSSECIYPVLSVTCFAFLYFKSGFITARLGAVFILFSFYHVITQKAFFHEQIIAFRKGIYPYYSCLGSP
jgi:hypothetical protein